MYRQKTGFCLYLLKYQMVMIITYNARRVLFQLFQVELDPDPDLDTDYDDKGICNFLPLMRCQGRRLILYVSDVLVS